MNSQENQEEKLSAFSDISEALSSGSIGRSYGNEGFVIVGNQLPINCTSEGDTASFEYGIAGLTFGARVLRIDDNGYITFAISPSVSASSNTREINGCGIIDLLSVRRLDSGSIRVKDGHTLILTGVLNLMIKRQLQSSHFLGIFQLLVISLETGFPQRIKENWLLWSPQDC